MKKAVGIAIILFLGVGLFLYLTVPVNVYTDNIAVTGTAVIAEYFKITGFRDKLHIVITGEFTLLLQIQIIDLKTNDTLYDLKKVAAENEDISIDEIIDISAGEYAIVYTVAGSFNLTVKLVVYASFMSSLESIM